MRDIPVHLLRNFATVAESRSITEAARSAGLSQSAMAASMQRLQEVTGLGLLVQGQTLQLTEAGRQFLIAARRVLDDLDEVERTVLQPRDLPGVTIALTAQTAISPFPQLARHFVQAFPNARLDVQQYRLESRALEAVRVGAADLGLISMVPAPDDLASVTIGEHRLSLIVPGGWPLDTSRGLASIGRFPYIDGTWSEVAPAARMALQRTGAQPQIVVRRAYLASVPALVAAGVGAALVIGPMAETMQRAGARITGEVNLPAQAVYLVRKHAARSSLVESLFHWSSSWSSPQ